MLCEEDGQSAAGFVGKLLIEEDSSFFIFIFSMLFWMRWRNTQKDVCHLSLHPGGGGTVPGGVQRTCTEGHHYEHGDGGLCQL